MKKRPSRLGLQNTPAAALQRGKTAQRSVPWPRRLALTERVSHMTLNNLMGMLL